MDNKDKPNSNTNNSSIILSLVLSMCFVMFIYSIVFQDELATQAATKTNYPSSPYVAPVEDDDRVNQEKLDRISLKIGSKKTKFQDQLQRIFREIGRPLAWDAAVEAVMTKTKDLMPGTPAPDDTFTLVSAVFDLGPDVPTMEINDEEAVLTTFLAHPQKKILFVEEALALKLSPNIDASNTRIVIIDMKAIVDNLGQTYKDIIQSSQNRNWKYSVHWLKNTAQAQYPNYTAASMSKILLLREASRLNPFSSKNFMWMDPSLKCVTPGHFVASKMDFFNKRFDKFFVSFFDYSPESETHGFPKHSWNYFSGDLQATTHKVVKGWSFGGQHEHIEITALAFEILMRETLREGQLGNADCVFSILLTRFPDLFHSFALSTACGKSTNEDMSCPGTSNPSGWCTPFVWAVGGVPA
eukprot:c7500_g1_i1.p1 GENE.c7500_g1_i1~~c7500_g1_i1.p1  ORF type:complete len:437 (-),score=113.89 c7500_g1_i1:168-1403(-)